MTEPLPAGKLPPELLAELLAGLAAAPGLLVGPRPGEDAAVIALPPGDLVVAADPITLTGAGVGAHAVHINANDVAVMGARPSWFLATVLLPPGTTADAVREIFLSMRQVLDQLGAALAGGHTEVTRAVTQPVVAGQMLGIVESGRAVASSGMRRGDWVVQVGPAPVEGAAVLAAEAGPRIAGVPAATIAAARDALRDPGISVVDAALLAAELGANAMHDPTEGGLATGLEELAAASGVGLEIDAAAVVWFEPGVALSRAVGVDPWGVLASGTLLAAFPGARAPAALQQLRDRGYNAAHIAVATGDRSVRLGDGEPFPRFARDEIARILEDGDTL